MELILKYFPQLDPTREKQLETLSGLIPSLNQQVNVISRKDIEHLEERHILHSLAIALEFPFAPGQSVIDVGTGGGFPGIPLAIMFPDTRFILVDSIGKKIRLVKEVSDTLGLKNVKVLKKRAENLNDQANFVVSRAVSAFPRLHEWTWPKIKPAKKGEMNGLISLKGGDLTEELKPFGKKVKILPISDYFEESFFSTKVIVYLKK